MARRKKVKPKTAKPKTPKARATSQGSITPGPKTQLWEGLLIALIGLLGLFHAFGLIDLMLINWPVLSSVILLAMGLIMMGGLNR